MNPDLIALLSVIRELQPISLREILTLIHHDDPRLPEPARMFLVLRKSVRFQLPSYAKDLPLWGLIEVENAAELTPETRLNAAPLLSDLLHIFDISLSNLLNRQSNTIEVTPIFPAPLYRKGKNAWARIFVAMPFRDELRLIYTDHILKVTKALDMSCLRGDDFSTANSIIHEVYSAIYHADLLIADCTGKNANVFYELGMAHMLGKTAILIAQSRDDFPFDIAHLRSITYTTTPEGMQQFETELEKTIRTELSLHD